MEIAEWIKKAINSIYNPKIRNEEKAKIFKEKIEDKINEIHGLCKEHNMPSLLFIEYGGGCALSQTNPKTTPACKAAFNLLNLYYIAMTSELSKEEFVIRITATVNAFKDAIKKIAELS